VEVRRRWTLNSKIKKIMTKLELERQTFLIYCSDENLGLYASGKKLNFDEVTAILDEVWRFGFMELYNDIIKQNIEAINKEAEYYENLPELWYEKYFLEELEKKVYGKIRTYLESKENSSR